MHSAIWPRPPQSNKRMLVIRPATGRQKAVAGVEMIGSSTWYKRGPLGSWRDVLVRREEKHIFRETCHSCQNFEFRFSQKNKTLCRRAFALVFGGLPLSLGCDLLARGHARRDDGGRLFLQRSGGDNYHRLCVWTTASLCTSRWGSEATVSALTRARHECGGRAECPWA